MELDNDGYEMESDGPGVLPEDEEATDHVFSSFYYSRAEDDNESPLFKAIRIGNIQTVRQLLDEGYSVNTVDSYGRTALHIAAESGQKDTISLLLDFGARIDVLDGFQRTVLQGAATNGNTDAVKLLLDRGASIDDTDALHNTALHWASFFSNTKVMTLLLNYGASIDATNRFECAPLHLAATHGNKEAVSLLVEFGASAALVDLYGRTALHLATESGCEEVIDKLLDGGASIDAKSMDGKTALHIAVESRHEGIISLLLNRGATIDATDETQETALHKAAKSGDEGILLLLLNSKASIEAFNINGRTPLHVAVETGIQKMVLLLLTRGANANAFDKRKYTALHIATRLRFAHLVPDLLHHGAIIAAKSQSGCTALFEAAEKGYSELVALLLERGAKAQEANVDGWTPLSIASKNGHLNVVEKLSQYGANLEARDHDGCTALYRAVRSGNSEIVSFLLNAGATIDSSNDSKRSLLYIAAESGLAQVAKIALDRQEVSEATIQPQNLSLIRAAECGHVDVVNVLLDYHADINSTDEDGWTALHRACCSSQSKVVLALLQKGADTEVKEKSNGWTPLFVAARHLDIIYLLVTHGADVTARSNIDGTALHYYSSIGQLHGLRLLLNHGSNIEETDRNRHTALHYALKNDHLEVVKMLLKHGADPNIIIPPLETTLTIAVKRKNVELLKLLLDEGADTQINLSNRMMVLHLAVINSSIEMVSLLLDRGAKVNVQDQDGNTPLYLAAKNNNLELAMLLVDRGAEIDSRSIFVKEGSKVAKYLAQVAANTLPNDKENESALHTDADFEKILLIETIFYQINIQFSSNTTTRSLVFEAWNTNLLPIRKYRHKYGTFFPSWKALKLEDIEETKDGLGMDNIDADLALNDEITAGSARFMRGRTRNPDSFDSILGISIDDWATRVIMYLLIWASATLFVSENCFILKLSGKSRGLSPRWAFHYDKMKGIIREPGRLILQIQKQKSHLSVPGWYRNGNDLLSFIDAVYLCRRASPMVGPDAFSDVLGWPEQKLTIPLHATLIAGLSIISIVGGHQNVDQLVKAVLAAGSESLPTLPDSTCNDWQVLNRMKCPCQPEFTHGPLTPIAAAKAIGLDVWRQREEELVTRVWDLKEDKLVDRFDVREVVFITHRRTKDEVEYPEVANENVKAPNGISTKAKKLMLIKEALLQYNTRYVWMDAICIDKSNLSELDEAIRSMYKWYYNCRAVVLDSGTPLDKWRKRGWCLQEGAAAGALYGISGGKLVSIQQLASEQKTRICKLDLSLYYRPGNAAQVLSRMDRRKTTRKEDITYALSGIFSIDLPLAYGEGYKAREKLLKKLTTEKGDLSFFSFPTIQTDADTYLPAVKHRLFLIAQCNIASTPAIVSHFGVTVEVKLLKLSDPVAENVLVSVENLAKYSRARCMAVTQLVHMARSPKIKNQTAIRIAIVCDIKSIMLIETHGEDRQTGGGNPIKCCHRLQCCQIEAAEFDRLFKDLDAKYERIWLGNKPINGTKENTYR